MHEADPANSISPDGDAGMPSQGVRTVVSFLLFLHFFAVAIGIASSWSPSPLTEAVRKVPTVAPYLELLWLDTSYFPLHRLTQGNLEDTDDLVEIEIQAAGGSKTRATFPSDDIWPNQRYRRYARFAEHLAGLADIDSLASLLPQDVAVHFAGDADPKKVKGTLRCRRHKMLDLSDATSSDRTVRDPYSERLYEDVYRADVRQFRGQIQVRKIEAKGENAPAAGGNDNKETP